MNENITVADQVVIEDTELAARIRKEVPIPRAYIAAAWKKIKNKEMPCEFFVSGLPDSKAVYDLAATLHAAAVTEY